MQISNHILQFCKIYITKFYMPEIIREFEEILVSRLREEAPFLQAIVGPRQVGKTTGVQRLYDSWQGPKIFESADNFQILTTEWLPLHWNKASEMGPNTLLIIDEIQKVPRWSEAVKLLFDRDRKKNLKVVLLGSASFKIQSNLSESLTGRYELIKVPHWNFSELSRAFSFTFEQFLMFGGYPGFAGLITDPLRWRDYVRDSIVETVLSKDLVDLANIRNPSLLKQVFALAMNYPAQEISFQKIVGQLTDKGAVATVKNYLELLEGTHLLRLLYKYSSKPVTTVTSSPKILPLAPALVHSITDANKISVDPAWKGRIFESAVGAALSQIADEMFYWRDGHDEVDFVVKIRDLVFAVEVKSSGEGNLKGLSKFTEKFKGSIPLVIDWEKGKWFLGFESLREFRNEPRKLLEI